MKRELNPQMAAWLDSQVKETAHRALISNDPREIFRWAMIACVGIREKGGNNRGRMVELIQDTLGTADGEPWCMSLVQTCLAFAELRSGHASPIEHSEHCLTVWRETPEAQRVRTLPAPGAIIIWRHGTSDSGHTGCTISAVSFSEFDAVEGNTESGLTAAGKIEREGGGVYQTRRRMTGAGNMHIVGYLKPF